MFMCSLQNRAYTECCVIHCVSNSFVHEDFSRSIPQFTGIAQCMREQYECFSKPNAGFKQPDNCSSNVEFVPIIRHRFLNFQMAFRASWTLQKLTPMRHADYLPSWISLILHSNLQSRTFPAGVIASSRKKARAIPIPPGHEETIIPHLRESLLKRLSPVPAFMKKASDFCFPAKLRPARESSCSLLLPATCDSETTCSKTSHRTCRIRFFCR